MTAPNPVSQGVYPRFKRWLLAERIEQVEGPYARQARERQQPWWKAVCLTGVDYFSTLGYIPGIAALAAGALSPIATLLIVALTLFAMLPMYRRVAEESPHGQGSIAMLERLLSFWPGKLVVLALLGFISTDFVITITLSASDAAVHLVENPLVSGALGGQEILVTLVLVAGLGAVFLRGIREAINLSGFIVGIYLLLNLVVVVVGLYAAFTNRQDIAGWREVLFTSYGSPLAMVGVALLVFLRLALGISGFETGVTVMPLVPYCSACSGPGTWGSVRPETIRCRTLSSSMWAARSLVAHHAPVRVLFPAPAGPVNRTIRPTRRTAPPWSCATSVKRARPPAHPPRRVAAHTRRASRVAPSSCSRRPCTGHTSG